MEDVSNLLLRLREKTERTKGEAQQLIAEVLQFGVQVSQPFNVPHLAQLPWKPNLHVGVQINRSSLAEAVPPAEVAEDAEGNLAETRKQRVGLVSSCLHPLAGACAREMQD